MWDNKSLTKEQENGATVNFTVKHATEGTKWIMARTKQTSRSQFLSNWCMPISAKCKKVVKQEWWPAEWQLWKSAQARPGRDRSKKCISTVWKNEREYVKFQLLLHKKANLCLRWKMKEHATNYIYLIQQSTTEILWVYWDCADNYKRVSLRA